MSVYDYITNPFDNLHIFFTVYFTIQLDFSLYGKSCLPKFKKDVFETSYNFIIFQSLPGTSSPMRREAHPSRASFSEFPHEAWKDIQVFLP